MNTPTITQHELFMISRKDLTALQLWHAHDRVTRGDADLGFALAHWTQVWGLMPWHLAPDENKIPREQRGLFRKVTTDLETVLAESKGDSEEFTKRASAIIEPLAAAHEQEQLRNPSSNISWSGCFGFNLADDGKHGMLHFYNACWPESPFDNMTELKDDLRQCLLALGNASPEVETVSCGSWINNLEPFAALFPKTYRASLTSTSPDGKNGMGWWGQFIRKDGTLNTRRAEELKQTGRFHYDRKSGKCAFREAI